MNKHWQLINAEAMHQQEPQTFSIPPLAERVDLQKGKLVKIGVHIMEGMQKRDECGGERFWVTITGRGKKLAYRGKITNDLVYTELHGLKGKDEIEFAPKHILQVEVPPPTPSGMRLRPLIITPGIREQIKRVVQYAEDHRINLQEIFHLMTHPEHAPGNTPERVVLVPHNYRCVFTIEQQQEGWMRHLSVSIGHEKNLPSPTALAELMVEFGFRKPPKEHVLFPMYETVASVNCLELLE